MKIQNLTALAVSHIGTRWQGSKHVILARGIFDLAVDCGNITCHVSLAWRRSSFIVIVVYLLLWVILVSLLTLVVYSFVYWVTGRASAFKALKNLSLFDRPE